MKYSALLVDNALLIMRTEALSLVIRNEMTWIFVYDVEADHNIKQRKWVK